MLKRTLRTTLVLSLLVAFTVLVSAAPVGAASRTVQTPKARHSFQPNGHSQAVPRMISTSTVPQVKGTGRGAIAPRPAPGGRANVPSPTNVMRAPAAPSPTNMTVKVSFAGQANTGWAPSDSNGAAGTKNYIETVNEQFEIYSKTGTAQYGTSFNSWFGLSGSLFDPKTVWDTTGKRFIFLIDTGSSLVISVAKQTNAIGSYCNYTFPTLSGDFADYPQLGVDANGVYATANIYTSSTVFPELFSISRTSMESCVTAGYTYWYGITNPDGSYAFAVVPQVVYSSDGGTEYMVNSYPGGACQLTLWSLVGTSLSNTTVGTQCYSPPPPAKQLGSAGTIDTNDDRMYQASYLNGLLSVATTGSHDWGDGNGPVGIVEWFVLNPATASVSSQGSFGTPGYWLFFPAMVVTGTGKMLFVYNSSGPTIYPSIWSISGCLCDTIAVASGVGYYGSSGSARWGDYESAWLDPVPNKVGKLTFVWVTGQYANATNSWGTWVDKLLPHS